MRRWGATILGLCVMGIAGCQSAGTMSASVGQSQTIDAANGEALLRVENRGFYDAVIYAIPANGVSTRVGTATGNTTTTMVLRADLLTNGGWLRFEANPIGGGQMVRSDRVQVDAGDEITLTIPPR